MGRFRLALARTRRAWLLLLGLGLLYGAFELVRLNWSDEGTLADAWLAFALWAWALAVVTALAYESVRPVTEELSRDRTWAGVVYGIAALPVLNLILVVVYAANQPSGVSFDVNIDRFFLILVALFLGPSLLSAVLAGGLMVARAEARWKRVLYWSAAGFVFAFPFANTFISSGFVYEQGGGMMVVGLVAVLAPVYAAAWKRRPGRIGKAEPVRLYPA